MRATPTGRERTFGEEEIIVSKTDLQGRITYANAVFLEIASYREAEVIGQAHSLIRHPSMPRCIFKLLWDTIESGREVFAYVINMGKYGDHYWVLAHVTPTFGPAGEIIGYHSSRRSPSRSSIDKVTPLYQRLFEVESQYSAKGDQLAASSKALGDALTQSGMEYEKFVWSL